jgi:hypothetical protein
MLASSIDFVIDVGKPGMMTDDDFTELRRWLNTEAIKRWINNTVTANESLSRVVPYLPELSAHLPFSPGAERRGTHEPIIRLLKESRTAQRGR